MIQPSDGQWRRRLPPTSTPGEQASDRDDEDSPDDADFAGNGGIPDGQHCCPVCEFASDEFDDVYAHLLTAHRKSTISTALLRGR